MLATFAFDVCHDVYLAAREAIDCKISTLNAEASGRYLWRPDRMPRLAEYVCDFALAGERSLGGDLLSGELRGRTSGDTARRMGGFRESPSPDSLGKSSSLNMLRTRPSLNAFGTSPSPNAFRTGPSQNTFRTSRLTMFRLHYLGGAEYQVARKHLGITELTWADWGEDIRGRVGRELMRAGLFPPSRYFQEATERPSDGRSSARAMGSAEFVAGVVVE